MCLAAFGGTVLHESDEGVKHEVPFLPEMGFVVFVVNERAVVVLNLHDALLRCLDQVIGAHRENTRSIRSRRSPTRDLELVNRT